MFDQCGTLLTYLHATDVLIVHQRFIPGQCFPCQINLFLAQFNLTLQTLALRTDMADLLLCSFQGRFNLAQARLACGLCVLISDIKLLLQRRSHFSSLKGCTWYLDDGQKLSGYNPFTFSNEQLFQHSTGRCCDVREP